MMKCRLLFLLLWVGLVALSCDLFPSNSSDPDDSRGDSQPVDTLDSVVGCDEAEQAAAWLSGEPNAPWRLREQIRFDLRQIRSEWLDSVSAVAIEFLPFGEFSTIMVGVTEPTWSAIKDSTYSAWNALNDLYGLDSAGVELCLGHCWLTLHFAGCQNPSVLARAYDTLPGFAEAYSWGRVGDSPLLLLEQVGDSIVYMFRFADGDCPAGCYYNTYDIFVSIDGRITYHGHIPDRFVPPEPTFGWIRAAWDRYYPR